MAEKRLLDQAEAILTRLSAPVKLADQENQLEHSLPPYLLEGAPQTIDQVMYYALPQSTLVLYGQANVPGMADVLTLAGLLIARLENGEENRSDSASDVYRLCLRGELTNNELEALCREHQLALEAERCVMVFHMVQTDNDRAYDLLHDLTPMQERDVLLDMDRHTVVLIKEMSDVESLEELVQFAQALQETLMGETAHQMTVGIGRSRHTLGELRESYAEARKAIEVGRVFKPEEDIFVFSHLILERFLMESSPDVSKYYHDLLFNRQNARLFNEEMLYTIDMFFKKDLNLSDTARQLYIHRNTLVYRLDKVQRQTGLDLRKFEDAVTFKILMDLKKVGGDRPPRRN